MKSSFALVSCLPSSLFGQERCVSAKALSLKDRVHFLPPLVLIPCIHCSVVSTSVQPIAWPHLTKLGSPSGKEGVVAMETWEYFQERKIVQSPNSFPHVSILFFSSWTSTFLSLSLWTDLTHSYALHIYSHLFTILFKIFVYKCVYKLKIISSCPVSEWHLQGKGCVGLRFLIALQEPTKRQHRTQPKCVCETGSQLIPEVSLSRESWHICEFLFLSEKMTHDLGPYVMVSTRILLCYHIWIHICIIPTERNIVIILRPVDQHDIILLLGVKLCLRVTGSYIHCCCVVACALVLINEVHS